MISETNIWLTFAVAIISMAGVIGLEVKSRQRKRKYRKEFLIPMTILYLHYKRGLSYDDVCPLCVALNNTFGHVSHTCSHGPNLCPWFVMQGKSCMDAAKDLKGHGAYGSYVDAAQFRIHLNPKWVSLRLRQLDYWIDTYCTANDVSRVKLINEAHELMPCTK